MATYFPIDVGVEFDCVMSDLIAFNWQAGTADFVIPTDSERVLRIQFASDAVVRMLDEMPLSIETHPGENTGLVPHHFAYRVEGAPFASSPSARRWGDTLGHFNHYCFVTGGGCLDALSAYSPEFSVVPR
jgi:hypothetical protein